MVETLGLSNPNIVESNLDRANIDYASHTRSDKGDEKLDSILEPIVAELKAYKVNMSLTLIYGSLETISDCFLYFSTKKGKDQFYPPPPPVLNPWPKTDCYPISCSISRK